MSVVLLAVVLALVLMVVVVCDVHVLVLLVGVMSLIVHDVVYGGWWLFYLCANVSTLA